MISRHHQSQKQKQAAVAPLKISITAACGAAHCTFIKRYLKQAHAILHPPLMELSIALVGDRRMSDLHEQFMSIAGPTDVLTFPLDLDEKGNPISGEVVLCVPEARRRARENGNLIANELLLYALHGMLHLCGYDDRTARAFTMMHRMEDDLLSRLGVGAVFETSPCHASSRSPAKSRQGRSGSARQQKVN